MGLVLSSVNDKEAVQLVPSLIGSTIPLTRSTKLLGTYIHSACCCTPDAVLDPLKEYSIVHIDAYPFHIERNFIAWLHEEYKQL